MTEFKITKSKLVWVTYEATVESDDAAGAIEAAQELNEWEMVPDSGREEPAEEKYHAEIVLTFTSYEQFEEFQNEAEGLWEVARDDENQAWAKEMHDLIECIEKQLDPRRDYPWTPFIPERLASAASDVWENMESNQ